MDHDIETRPPLTESTPDVSRAAAPVDRRTMIRRPFAVVAATLGNAILAGCDFTTADFDRRVHFLKRFTFGATPGARDHIAAIGETAWLTEQLEPSTIDTGAVDAKIAALPAMTQGAADLFASYSAGLTGRVTAQLQLAATIRAVESPAQLQERMVEFWSDHFNVPAANRALTLYKIVEDRTVIRPLALTTFRQLLVGSATSPAMLDYLDNAKSSVGAINENYGRELLELHTVGVNGGYTEADVVSTARLLTGWGISTVTREFKFSPARHDASPLTIMGWTRPTTGTPFSHGVAFLRWLAVQPACARFVCTKLARRFVADRPDTDLVQSMVDAWLANNSAIAPVLRAMVAHPAFDAAVGAKFRRPLDSVYFTLRAANVSIESTTDRTRQRRFVVALEGLGQTPFGWPAPNGYPDVEGAWLNTGALLGRWNFAADVVGRGFPILTPDLSALRASLAGKRAAEIYDLVAQALVLESVTDAGTSSLNTALGWTDALTPTPAQIDAAFPTILVAVLSAADSQHH